ncbi:hypothetical protein JCM8097_005435 [Rhodosporidiobolus ruineniae]
MLFTAPPADDHPPATDAPERAHLALPWQAERDERTDEEGPLDEEEEADFTPALLRIAAIAGLGGLLFGFDTGVVSGALLVIRSDLGGAPLTLAQESWLVTSALVGALGGSIAANRMADWRGRKPVIVGAAVLFAVGALEQAAAQVFKEVIFGRILVGIAVGLASMTLPVYLAEISPAALRGRLVASNVVFVTGGQVVAYLVDAVFYNVPSGWRYMFGFGAVPPVVQLCLSFSMPESPRFLLQRGKFAQARKTLQQLHPKASTAAVQRKIEAIQAELGDEPGRGRREAGARESKVDQLGTLWRDRANRRALVVAVGLQAFAQLSGFNSLMYFSGKIIALTHLSQPAAFACFVSVSNFLSTLVALRLVDRLGRRTLLLRTLVGMVVGMSLLAVSFVFMPGGEAQSQVGEVVVRAAGQGPNAWAFVSLLGIVIFCCSFALGLGNLAWVVQSEVFNQDLRALGNGIATAVCWLCNLTISATFLYISKALTPAGAFGLYAVIAAVGWGFTYRYVPETKGLTLDEVRAVFEREVGMAPHLSSPGASAGSAGASAGARGYHVLEAEEEGGSEEESDEREEDGNDGRTVQQ